VTFAKKIVVTHYARAVYTARVPVHGTYTAVTLHGLTRPVHGRVDGPFTAVYTAVYTRIRVHSRYKAVLAPYNQFSL